MLNIGIIFIYLFVLLLLSIIKRPRYIKEWFIGDNAQRSSNQWLLVATIFVSSIGGGMIFGLSEKVFLGNLAYTYALIFAILAEILIAIYCIPRFTKYKNMHTVGDIMYSHYGDVGKYITSIFVVLVSMGFMSVQIKAISIIFSELLQIDEIYCLLFSYIILLTYTTIGGFKSLLFLSQIQFLAIIIAIPLTSGFAIYHTGIEKIIKIFPYEKVSFFANDNLFCDSLSLMMVFLVMNMFPTFIQRILINKDSKIKRNALYIKSGFYFLLIIFITFNSLMAFIHYPEIEAQKAILHLINEIIPKGIQAIVLIGLISSIISTADSELNIISVTIMRDVIKSLCNLRVHSRGSLFIARIMNIFVGIFVVIIALFFEEILDLSIFIAGFWSPTILVPLIFAIFGIVINIYGFMLCVFCGITTFIMWEIYEVDFFHLKGIVVGTLVNLILFIFCIFVSHIQKIIKQKSQINSKNHK